MCVYGVPEINNTYALEITGRYSSMSNVTVLLKIQYNHYALHVQIFRGKSFQLSVHSIPKPSVHEESSVKLTKNASILHSPEKNRAFNALA